MNSFSLYEDIDKRTNGEIYMAVVGPVRTGKSTFIRRFSELFVLPNTEDESRTEILDQLPISGSGTTITTVEPKFIPKNGCTINVGEEDNPKYMKLRLIDCVGYMVEGANGHMSDGEIRMVKTPWLDDEIPFVRAADIGTKRVIHEHSTMAVVITTDGTISDIPRENYVDAEEMTVMEMNESGKPYVIILNTERPYSEETKGLVSELSEKYNTPVLPMNLEQLKDEDVSILFEKIVSMFPIAEISFNLPDYVFMLEDDSSLGYEIFDFIRHVCDKMNVMKDVKPGLSFNGFESIEGISLEYCSMESGKVCYNVKIKQAKYYEFMSGILGENITCESEYISAIKSLSALAKEYRRIKDAWSDATELGYGVVLPDKEEIILHEPELIKQGNRFGVKIHANAPCTHFIRTEIDTELAPIVGSETQAKDLIEFIKTGTDRDILWNTNVFGKSMGRMVEEGIETKITSLNDETREKLRNSMDRIVNESCGLVCFVI